MDPFSVIVTAIAVWGLLQRAPGLIGEAVREWQHARRGEESPAARARRERLEKDGVDPAKGGPMRQYVGNVWRDFWLDMENARRQRRADQATDAAVDSWRRRFADRLDARIDEQVGRWRARPDADRDPPVSVDPGNGQTDAPDGTRQKPTRQTGPPPAATGRPPGPDPVDIPLEDPTDHDDIPHEGVVHDSDEYTPRPPQEDNRPPIRVTAVVGDPINTNPPQPASQPAQITAGENMTASSAVAVAVTGVVSGAAEARIIRRDLENATNAYLAQLAKVRARVIALGEQTVGTVQMSTNSRVVNAVAQAAEAAAAAEQAAKGCGSEVGPQLDMIAREFDRVNS